MNSEAPLYVSIREAARLLGISRWSVDRLIRRRLIPHVVYPIGGIRISTADLEAFRDRCRRPAIAILPAPSKRTRAQVRLTSDELVSRTKRLALAKLGRTQ